MAMAFDRFYAGSKPRGIDRRAAGGGEGGQMNRALFSSASVEWEAPAEFFDVLDKEFHFTVDVCALPDNAKCARFYTPDDDGLSMPWNGVVWCNPPYGREIYLWIKRAVLAADGGATVVMLLPARTDTKWFHDFVYNRAEIRFLRGRLKFGGAKNSAPFPSMLAIFRPKENA